MVFIYLIATIVLVGLCRQLFAKLSGLSKVEYGWGFGPTLIKIQTQTGLLRINALPIGDYAKLPTRIVFGDNDEEIEECIATKWQQHLVNIAPIVVLLIAVSFTTIILKRSIITDCCTIIFEWLSVIGYGNNNISYINLLVGDGLNGFHFTIIAFTILNCMPVSTTPIGFVLGLNVVKNRFVSMAMICLFFIIFLSAWIAVIW